MSSPFTPRRTALSLAAIASGVLLAVAPQPAPAATVFDGPPPVSPQGFLDLPEIVTKTRAELARIGVAEEAVTEITYYVKQRSNANNNNERVTGVDVVMRLEMCESGYLTLDFTAGGYLRQTYTRYGCTLEGVPAY